MSSNSATVAAADAMGGIRARAHVRWIVFGAEFFTPLVSPSRSVDDENCGAMHT